MDIADATSVTNTYAVDCAVSGSVLYVGGGVDNGADIVVDQQILSTQRGGDIWVVSLHSEIGTINWVKQVDTDKNDELDRHDAIGIDPAGNAIL